MCDSAEIQAVQRILEDAGLLVNPVPPAECMRCDLRATDELDDYLIEVKRFDDDEAVADTRQSGGDYLRDRPRFSSHTVADVIAKAAKQLSLTAKQTGDGLRVVALLANASFGADLTNILGTLYGIRKVAAYKDGSSLAWDCLYVLESAFFRHRREVDGALILDRSHFGLFLNDYGARADRLRQSGLAGFCRAKCAFRDAATWENDGFLVADCDAARSDESAVLRHLEQKYGLTRAIGMHSFEYRGLHIPRRLP